jgi:hypothetical protein
LRDVAPYNDECDHVFLIITSASWNFMDGLELKIYILGNEGG